MSLGFAIHNYFSWKHAQDNVEPVLKKIVKEKYEVANLPYKHLDLPKYRTKKFPHQEVYQNDINNSDDFVAQVDSNDRIVKNEALEYRLNQAINDSNISYDPDEQDEVNFTITDLSEDLQRQIPKFVYGSHVYSSKNEDRFITLNNQKYHEGDHPFGVLKIIKIEPNLTVFRIKDITFSLSSLTDWQGYGN